MRSFESVRTRNVGLEVCIAVARIHTRTFRILRARHPASVVVAFLGRALEGIVARSWRWQHPVDEPAAQETDMCADVYADMCTDVCVCVCAAGRWVGWTEGGTQCSTVVCCDVNGTCVVTLPPTWLKQSPKKTKPTVMLLFAAMVRNRSILLCSPSGSAAYTPYMSQTLQTGRTDDSGMVSTWSLHWRGI